jgi:hypothetical protein
LALLSRNRHPYSCAKARPSSLVTTLSSSYKVETIKNSVISSCTLILLNNLLLLQWMYTDKIVFLTHTTNICYYNNYYPLCSSDTSFCSGSWVHGHKVIKHAISTTMKNFLLLKQNTVYMK